MLRSCSPRSADTCGTGCGVRCVGQVRAWRDAGALARAARRALHVQTAQASKRASERARARTTADQRPAAALAASCTEGSTSVACVASAAATSAHQPWMRDHSMPDVTLVVSNASSSACVCVAGGGGGRGFVCGCVLCAWPWTGGVRCVACACTRAAASHTNAHLQRSARGVEPLWQQAAARQRRPADDKRLQDAHGAARDLRATRVRQRTRVMTQACDRIAAWPSPALTQAQAHTPSRMRMPHPGHTQVSRTHTNTDTHTHTHTHTHLWFACGAAVPDEQQAVCQRTGQQRQRLARHAGHVLRLARPRQLHHLWLDRVCDAGRGVCRHGVSSWQQAVRCRQPGAPHASHSDGERDRRSATRRSRTCPAAVMNSSAGPTHSRDVMPLARPTLPQLASMAASTARSPLTSSRRCAACGRAPAAHGCAPGIAGTAAMTCCTLSRRAAA
jgi:hypothetical protein